MAGIEDRAEKTGQGIDVQKRELLAPLLAEEILQYRRDSGELAPIILDFGSGDGTSALYTAEELYMGQGKPLGGIISVDVDDSIIGPLVKSGLEVELPEPTIQGAFVGSNSETMGLVEDLYPDGVDICYAQMSLHQILRDSELALSMSRFMRVLKDGGIMLVADLHPMYIDYLQIYEPSKFRFDDKSEIGEYFFDSGGSVRIRNRGIHDKIAEIGVGLGFVETGLTHILPVGLSANKERYVRMVEREIPLFYMLKMELDLRRVGYLEEGTIKSVKHRKSVTEVVFDDGEEIGILFPDDRRPTMNAGDILTLLEVKVPERRKRYLNLWVERVKEDRVVDVGWWRHSYEQI